MSLAAELWEAARHQADICLAHPFVRGIADGTLDSERYRHFLAQDAYFLEAFARGYAHCLSRSPDREGVYSFGRLVGGVFDELALHRAAARELDIDLDRVVPAPATVHYSRFLTDAVAAGASVGETLAAMTPCMRLYAYLGERIAAETHGGTGLPAVYRDWVAAYAGDDFQGLAALIEQLLDRYAAATERERAHYRRVMALERAFFDAAWIAVPERSAGSK